MPGGVERIVQNRKWAPVLHGDRCAPIAPGCSTLRFGDMGQYVFMGRQRLLAGSSAIWLPARQRGGISAHHDGIIRITDGAAIRDFFNIA